MGLMRELFGPSRDEIWRQLAQEVGGQFNEGGWFGTDFVQVNYGDWTVTLDNFTVSTGKSSTTYTRIRAPFINRDGFRFTLYRSGFFTGLGKYFGMQDLEVGDPLFDERFVIQSNNPQKVGALLASPRIRELLMLQSQVGFSVQDDEGWFGAKFPDGVDQIYFQIHGVLTDLNQLRNAFDLFAELLNRLCHLDSAYKDDLSVLLETLFQPGGQVRSSNIVLWDGDRARYRAVQSLAQYRDNVQVVDALLTALPASPPFVQHAILLALGNLGNHRAAPHLVPFLGVVDAQGSALRAAADSALRQLGAAALCDDFVALVNGDLQALNRLPAAWQPLLAAALRAVISSPYPREVSSAAAALAEWNVQEASPELNEALRTWRQDPGTLEAVEKALELLEKRAALPRPAMAPVSQPDGTLPLPSAPAAPNAESLPRPGAAPE